ncbi:hypothetical protein MJK70_20810 [Klebsiella pneumoniae]|nr:hypothetical protein MJK70_20810 [Klebsiella pneumoniae]
MTPQAQPFAKIWSFLEHAGTVIRTYGGVVLNKDESPIRLSIIKHSSAPTRKALIAEAAGSFIHDGDSIILDAGSTVLQMVPPALAL